MTENRKFALRTVIERNLYTISICCELNEFKIYSPISWLKHSRNLKAAALFARWLQKLAFYSSINFEGFDEKVFWEEHELLCKKFPNVFVMTRQFYEQDLQRITEEKVD